MNGIRIFKMEFFKLFRDKPYLLITAILFVLNLIFSGSFYYSIRTNAFDSNEFLTIYFFLLALLLFVGNYVFFILYPFRILSIDYKNSVLATMIASGVDRRKLFFAKFGATFLIMLLLGLILFLVPGILLILSLSTKLSETELSSFSSFFSLNEFQTFSGIPWLHVIFNSLDTLFVFCSSILLIFLSSILLRGQMVAFLVYIGLTIFINVLLSFCLFVLFLMRGDAANTLYFQTIFHLLIGVGVGYLAYSLFQRQIL